MKWAMFLLAFFTLSGAAYNPPSWGSGRNPDRFTSSIEGVPLEFYGSVLLSSRETNVPVRVYRATFLTESNFDPTAVSKGGDKGLGQHNKTCVYVFSLLFNRGVIYDPMNAHENIMITGRILADHFYTSNHGAKSDAKSWTFAFAFYNQGVGSVYENGICKSTMRYVRDMERRMKS